jgi:2-(1,2-epoxy-1,2-dihydrophenyl)acetyl-CoA isomerase
MGTNVIVEKKGKVTIIHLNIPDKLNPLDPPLRADLRSALNQFRDDSGSNVTVLTGEGRAFSAGGDLEEMKEGFATVFAVEHMAECNDLILQITGIAKPIIAAVNGAAAGAGFSITMACDMAVASKKASFMQAFAKVGLIPDMGSVYLLPRTVGMQRAKELIWTARRVNADEALQLGIVNYVVEHEDLMPFVMKLAEQIADAPPFAVGMGKTLMARSLESSLQDMLQYEGLTQAICLRSEDHQEGVKAFYEKRPPKFVGK